MLVPAPKKNIIGANLVARHIANWIASTRRRFAHASSMARDHAGHDRTHVLDAGEAKLPRVEWRYKFGARLRRDDANADKRNDQPGLALPASQNNTLEHFPSIHIGLRPPAVALPQKPASTRSGHANSIQPCKELLHCGFSPHKPPHLYVWRNVSRNIAALGQLQQKYASLIHIVTWGAASFAGLPWVSPSPVQATTRLSEAAQKTSSPAWWGHANGSDSAPVQANSLTPGATLPQPVPLHFELLVVPEKPIDLQITPAAPALTPLLQIGTHAPSMKISGRPFPSMEGAPSPASNRTVPCAVVAPPL